MNILQEESNLMEIVKLIGEDVLPDEQRAVLEIARVIRLGFLQQNAYHAEDTYVPLEKQFRMMDVMLHLYKRVNDIIGRGILLSKIKESGIMEEVVRMKYNISNNDIAAFDTLKQKIDKAADDIIRQNS